MSSTERGWPEGTVGFTTHLRDKLKGEALQLDIRVSLVRIVQLDKKRRPIVSRVSSNDLPVAAVEAVRQVIAEMPERAVLEALANTANWEDWPRHSRLRTPRTRAPRTR